MSSTKIDKKVVDKVDDKKTVAIPKAKAKAKPSKKQQKADKQKGKIVARKTAFDKLLAGIELQKTGATKLTIAKAQAIEKGATSAKTKEIARREKIKGKTVDVSKKGYRKCERAILGMLALFTHRGLINPSYFTKPQLIGAFVKIANSIKGVKVDSNNGMLFKLIRHNFYQCYCDTPEFRRGGATFANMSELRPSGKYAPITDNQGGWALASTDKELWAQMLKENKTLQPIVKAFIQWVAQYKSKYEGYFK